LVPTLLVVRGQAGSGKSNFLADLASLASQRKLRVAWVDAVDSAIPLLAIDRLTRELGTRTDNLTSDLDRLHRLRTACQRASAGRPAVLIVIDHVEELLAQDRSALVDLMVNPPCANLILAVAIDSASIGRLAFSVETTAPPDLGSTRARRLEVELLPLTTEEITLLAESRFGIGAVAARFSKSVEFLSGGLMRHVSTILTLVEELDEIERQLVLSGSELVEPAIVRGPPLRNSVVGDSLTEDSILLVARGLAAWMVPSTVSHLATLLEVPPDSIEARLALMQDRGVITMSHSPLGDLYRFVIPLARVEVVRETPEVLRRQLAARVGMIKEESAWPTDPVMMAQHFVTGQLELTPDRIQILTAAAEKLTHRSRYARAQRLLRGAIRQDREVGQDNQLPGEALSILAETLSRTGASDEAHRILMLERGTNPVSAADSVLRRARDHVARGQDQDAVELLEHELAAEHLEPSQRLQVMLDLGRLLIQLGRLEEGATLSHRTSAEALAQNDTRSAVESEINSHVRYLYDGLPRRALEHGRRALLLAHSDTDERLQARTLSAIGNALTDSAGLTRASRWLQRARERAESAEDFATLSWTTQLLAVNCIERGDWLSATHLASSASHIDAVLHRSRSLRLSEALQDWLQALRGEPSTNGRLINKGDLTRGAGRTEAFVFQAACQIYLLRGEEGDALSLCGEVIRALESRRGNRRQLISWALPAQAAVAFQAKQEGLLTLTADRLRELLDDVGQENAIVRPELDLTDAMLHAMDDGWDQAAPLALRASRRFRELGYHRREALAEQLAGDAFREAGDADRAHEHLTAAFTSFKAMGAAPRVEAVRHSLHLLGRRAPRDHGRAGQLTHRQWEIATLAAQGKSDREIGVILGIRHRTVTTHMSNALRALHISTRKELPQWLAAQDADGVDVTPHK